MSDLVYAVLPRPTLSPKAAMKYRRRVDASGKTDATKPSWVEDEGEVNTDEGTFDTMLKRENKHLIDEEV